MIQNVFFFHRRYDDPNSEKDYLKIPPSGCPRHPRIIRPRGKAPFSVDHAIPPVATPLPNHSLNVHKQVPGVEKKKYMIRPRGPSGLFSLQVYE